ncbi:UNVERIFIED_ORG: hypothetical protein J2W85_002412 [Ensifer adhaerens]|nr:hypothetical protein [Ensifer adhaerens]
MIAFSVLSKLRGLAFAILALAVGLPTASLSQGAKNDDAAGEFFQFFKGIYTDGQEKDGVVVGPWPSPLDACVFGDTSDLSKRRVTLLFAFVRFVSVLYVEPHFVTKLGDCPSNSRFYVRFHSDEPTLLEAVQHDVGQIRYGLGIDVEKEFKFSRFGMGYFIGDVGAQSVVYAAIDQFDRNETPYDEIMANNVIQQEIVQMILLAPDSPTKDASKSIIQENHLDVVPGDFGGEPKYRKAWSERNVPNLCVYDVMLLEMIYSNAAYDSDGSLAFYKNYILENFARMNKSATEKLNDRDFAELFPKKC